MNNTKHKMLLSSSIGTIQRQYTMEESIDLMYDAGFDAIDFSFHVDEKFYSEETSPDFFKNLKQYTENKGMIFNQAHAPFKHPKDKEEMDKYIADIIQCIKNSALLGVKTIVVHPLKSTDIADGEHLFDANMEFYNIFRPYCEEYGVKVALENMFMGKWFINGGVLVDSTCSKPEEFIRYLDELNSDCFVACLDIGHALLVRQDPAEFIRVLGNKRLKALHVHDVDGSKDLHTMPYYGGFADWDSIAKALKDINYEGDFTLEAGNFLKPLPKELYPMGAKMMVEISRHIMNKISGY